MAKLFARNGIIGIIYLSISLAITAAFTAAFGALIKLINQSFNPLLYLIIGGLCGLICNVALKNLFIAKNGFFLPAEFDGTQPPKKIRKFWIERIKNKAFIKKRTAQLTYLPFFVLFIGMVVLAGVFFTKLSILAKQYYIVSSLICAIIGSAAVSSLMYAIFGLTSITVCPKCGSVNAFVYDEYLDFEMVSGFAGNVSGGSAKHHGMSWGGWFPMHTYKVEKFGDVISRHCECCGNKSTYSTQWQDTKYLQPKNPTKG